MEGLAPGGPPGPEVRLSYKAEFSTDRGATFATNSLRFATEAEAALYARDLASRWLAVTDFRTAESCVDGVTHEIADGTLRRLEYSDLAARRARFEQRWGLER